MSVKCPPNFYFWYVLFLGGLIDLYYLQTTKQPIWFSPNFSYFQQLKEKKKTFYWSQTGVFSVIYNFRVQLQTYFPNYFLQTIVIMKTFIIQTKENIAGMNVMNNKVRSHHMFSPNLKLIIHEKNIEILFDTFFAIFD